MVGVALPDDGVTAETDVVASFLIGELPVVLTGSVGGAAPDYNEWTLYGMKKMVRLYDWYKLRVADAGTDFAEVMPERGARPLQLELDEVANMIQGEAHVLPTLADGLAVQKVIEELLEG